MSKPGAPTPVTAEKVESGYKITWTRPTSDSPVWRYVIRAKGQPKIVTRLGSNKGVENPTREYLWTKIVSRASEPLTFQVRAVNSSGAGPWAEAEVTVPEPPAPEPTNDEKLGVRVFPQYSGKTYGNHAAVLSALDRLGTKRISGLLTPNMGADEIKFYQDAAALGIRVWFACGTPGAVLDDSKWTLVRALLVGPFKGIVEIISGWNEPNHQVSGDWSTTTANHQKKLWANVQQVNADTGQNILVGTPPLWSGNVNDQYSHLSTLAPKIQGAYDVINWHLYPHGNKGQDLEDMLDLQVSKFKAAYGDVPILNSESGYFTAANYTGGSNPSTEAEQAEQLPELARMHLDRKILLSYFELLDDPDPSGANRESNFGLIRTPSLSPSTWSDKPAFAAYKAKIAE